MELKVSNFGKNLGSRDLGEIVRKELLSMMEHEHQPIVISFDGVFMVSSSFADECLGKLISGIGIEGFKESFVIKEITDQRLKSVLSRAIKQRLASTIS